MFDREGKFFIETWGCQMNAHDAEKMSGSLRHLGLEPTEAEAEADVVILNTCSVREKAQEKVFHRLQGWDRVKKQREIVIGVTGCVAQQEGAAIFARAPSVDFVLGTQSLGKLPEVLATVVGTKERVSEIGRHEESLDYSPEQIERVPGIKAYITIMEGCDNFCTFCIVPFTRGRERCRPVAHIVREAEALARAGFREVQLLGQNVNSYRDPDDGRTFEELIDAVHEVEGLWRIRFTSPHPKDFGEPMIRRFRDLPKLCPHMHLPVQSGSTPVLARMNRGYSREDYLDKVGMARERVPHLALTTDIIVGFCGETDSEFDDTLDLVDRIAFDGIYSFKYSERPFTQASKTLQDDVAEPVKTERLHHLQEHQKHIQLRKHASMIGREVDVLVEGESKKQATELSGRTADNCVVNFAGEHRAVGSLVRVRIERAGANSLFGTSTSIVRS